MKGNSGNKIWLLLILPVLVVLYFIRFGSRLFMQMSVAKQTMRSIADSDPNPMYWGEDYNKTTFRDKVRLARKDLVWGDTNEPDKFTLSALRQKLTKWQKQNKVFVH